HTLLCTSAGIPCLPPPDIPNGRHSGRLQDEFHYGTSVTYSCQPGLALHGEPSIHCTTRDGQNGVWKIQCQPNNTWEPPVPVCQQGKSGCRAPARLGFAELKEPYRNRTVFPEGSRVELECQPGYSQLLGVSAAITCLSNQSWSAALHFCTRKQCPSPESPENGRAVVLTDLLFGSKINYTCDKGYKLVGGSQRICEVSGTGVSWSGDPPVCVTCAAPPAIPHGTHTGGDRDSFSLGDVVTYSCSSGLAPAGDPSLTCTSEDGENGTWRGTVPQCQGTAQGVPRATSPTGGTTAAPGPGTARARWSGTRVPRAIPCRARPPSAARPGAPGAGPSPAAKVCSGPPLPPLPSSASPSLLSCPPLPPLPSSASPALLCLLFPPFLPSSALPCPSSASSSLLSFPPLRSPSLLCLPFPPFLPSSASSSSSQTLGFITATKPPGAGTDQRCHGQEQPRTSLGLAFCSHQGQLNNDILCRNQSQ
uniref:Sushi domain-containing protein n=1 Tax=Catharus ustulatus TaxID=91951 RepID=A0A8C3VBN3_CATUS